VKNYGELKDKALLFGWIAGLLLFISVLWIATHGAQGYYLMRAVNSVFINNDDPRRVTSLLQKPDRENKHQNLMGFWYSMHLSQDSMFVFTVFQDGIMLPLGAIVSPDGNVEEIIPLSAHSEYVFDSLPKSVLQMYITRIEGRE